MEIGSPAASPAFRKICSARTGPRPPHPFVSEQPPTGTKCLVRLGESAELEKQKGLAINRRGEGGRGEGMQQKKEKKTSRNRKKQIWTGKRLWVRGEATTPANRERLSGSQARQMLSQNIHFGSWGGERAALPGSCTNGACWPREQLHCGGAAVQRGHRPVERLAPFTI
uniref:Uncharacterized protein n=1 Tax=Sphaerodactylus townsendi TaxID=933632 RepID=A0ACB8EXT2_9SAUR